MTPTTASEGTPEQGIPDQGCADQDTGNQASTTEGTASDVADRQQRRTFSDRLPRPWLFPLLVFAATWAAIVITWQVANLVTHTSWSWSAYFWYKDAGYYGEIARTWYTPHHGRHVLPTTAAFFPVFPAAIRLCSFLAGGSIAFGGLIAVVGSGAAAVTAVWALAARIKDRYLADRTVLLFAAFPGAMTLGMMYSEPLGIALAASCLLATLNRRWLTAGLLAGVASGEHPTLIVLTPVLAIAAAQAIVTRRDWRALIAPALAPLGLIGYFAWIGTVWHDYGFWSKLEKKTWGVHTDYGVHVYRIFTLAYPHMERHAVYFAMIMTLLVAGLIGIALMLAARVPLPVSLYTIGLYAGLVVSGAYGPTPRFVWPMLGAFIGAAARLPRWLYWPMLVASFAILCFLIGWYPHHPMSPPP
jgi:hypothetical protein